MKHRLLSGLLVPVLLGLTLPAAARQAAGIIQGIVKDLNGQPVEGALVIVESTEGVPRKLESQTGRNGDFVQVGLSTGIYQVTVEKNRIFQIQYIRVSGFETSAATFVLAPPAALAPTPEALAQRARDAEMRKIFVEGVEAAQASRFAEALAKFTKTIELSPKCAECYYNLGAVYAAQERYEPAAEAVLKGDELVAAAGADAPSPNPVALYHHGVILWHGGKYPEAKSNFQAAVKADPSHAESHYSLGVALIQEGNLAGGVAEFETYLKLAPQGEHAAQAREFAAQARPR
jgi:tetratricopeptide (TPR) repeat protein